MSFSLSCDRFKYPLCSSLEILEHDNIFPLEASKFSTFIKFTSPSPDLSRGVVPFVIRDVISRSSFVLHSPSKPGKRRFGMRSPSAGNISVR